MAISTGQNSRYEDVVGKVRALISLEHTNEPDWDRISNLANEAIRYINENEIADAIPNRMYQFLEDVDIRRDDQKYSRWQLDRLRDECPDVF